jgi:hypothetical protein
LSKSVQTGESPSLWLTLPTTLFFKYLDFTKSCNNPASLSSPHHHLHSRLMFIFQCF